MDTHIVDELIQGRVEPYIYAFATNTIPNYLKVGDTYRPISVRLDEWRQHYPDLEQKYAECAKINDRVYFRDFAVHDYLVNKLKRHRLEKKDLPSPPRHLSREFFRDTSKQDITAAVAYIRADFSEKRGEYQFYDAETTLPVHVAYASQGRLEPRDNQKAVIAAFKSAVAAGRKKLLMYAVMRFGKSFTAMCCAQEISARLVVVVSAKADVADEWRQTVESIENFRNDYEFITPQEIKANHEIIGKKLQENRRAVVFLTLQDLQGDDIKDKHQQIFTQKIDLLIVDETHFGARAESYGKILKNTQFANEKKHKHDDDDRENPDEVEESLKALDVEITLHLSGTPYRILMGGEFPPESIIAFCQFSDIVRAKEAWDAEHLQDDSCEEWDNPYFGFPQMIRFAFNPNESSRQRIAELKKQGISYVFSALLEPQSIRKDASGRHKKFKHEAEILDLLKTIDGSKEDDELFGFLDYPRIKEGSMCRHMVMVLPYCASCDALEALLKTHAKEFRNLQEYEIINISGRDDPDRYSTPDAIKAKVRSCEEQNRKTLTLTVNRMLTGSTVKEWDTMLFLKDSASPQEYDQAIFRLQNPYVVPRPQLKPDGTPDDSKPPVKINLKPQTLLVDFDPCRMFVMQEKKAQIYNVNTDQAGNDKLRERLKEELRISPIVTVNAGEHKMEKITPVNIMDAVSAYSSSRGVMDEAGEIGVDLALKDNPDVWSVIAEENELGAKGGFVSRAAEGEGSTINVPPGLPEPPPPPGGAETPGEAGENSGQEEDDLKSVVNRFRMYYTRILYYAFLTETEVISLADVLKSCSTEENQRIFRNLGLRSDILTAFLGMDKFVLRELDYAIQHLSKLSHDSSKTPLERAAVADKKFGRLGESQIVTPAFIADEMVALFPDEFFRECVQEKRPILDIASKKGEFAAALFRKFSALGYGVADFRSLICSIPTSTICYEFTRKVYEMLGLDPRMIASRFTSYDLLDVKDPQGRIDYPKIRALLCQHKDFELISMKDKISTQETEQGKMEFGAVVGNPPYQEEDGGAQKSALPIYDRFVKMGKAIFPKHVSFIIPTRWYSGGKGNELSAFRDEMLNDECIRELHDFLDPKEVFPDTNNRGGICYFIRSEDYNNILNNVKVTTHTKGNVVYSTERPLKIRDIDVFIRDGRAISIIDKVLPLSPKNQTINKYISSAKAFGFRTYFIDDPLFRAKPKGLAHPVKCYGRGNKIGYVDLFEIKTHTEWINLWKVFIPESNNIGTELNDDNQNTIVGAPKTICTETFLVVGAELNLDEIAANNLASYLRTRIARFLLSLAKTSQHGTAKTYRFVPLQNFTSQSDIDWSKPIPEIDKQLYKKYGLNAEEIAFIESSIKPME